MQLQYCIVKKFGSKKGWQIGTQNRFGRVNFGGLSIYTEGKQKSWLIKLGQIHYPLPNLPRLFTATVFYYMVAPLNCNAMQNLINVF